MSKSCSRFDQGRDVIGSIKKLDFGKERVNKKDIDLNYVPLENMCSEESEFQGPSIEELQRELDLMYGEDELFEIKTAEIKSRHYAVSEESLIEGEKESSERLRKGKGVCEVYKDVPRIVPANDLLQSVTIPGVGMSRKSFESEADDTFSFCFQNPLQGFDIQSPGRNMFPCEVIPVYCPYLGFSIFPTAENYYFLEQVDDSEEAQRRISEGNFLAVWSGTNLVPEPSYYDPFEEGSEVQGSKTVVNQKSA